MPIRLLVSSCLLLALVLSSGTLCAQEVKYFRHAQFDRRHHFAFDKELHGSDTDRVRHYQVTYDKKGRVIEWRYYRYAGKIATDPHFNLASTNITYTGNNINYAFLSELNLPAQSSHPFTGDGHTNETLMYDEKQRDSIGPFMYIVLKDRMGKKIKKNRSNASVYRCYLDSNGLIIRKQFLDTYGRLVLGRDGSAELRYQNDENGFLSDLIGYDLAYHENWRDHYTNDAEGRFLEKNYLDSLGHPLPTHWTDRYRYDSNGYQISHTQLNKDEVFRKLETTEYDRYGNLIISREYDRSHNLVEQIERSYDSTNQYLGFMSSNEADGVYDRDSIVYDAKGRETEVWYFTSVSSYEHHPDSVRSAFRRYLDDWRDVEIEYRNSQGKLIPGKHGAALIRSYSNEWGEVTRVEYKDAKGSPHNSTVHGCAVIEYLDEPGGFSYIKTCIGEDGLPKKYGQTSEVEEEEE